MIVQITENDELANRCLELVKHLVSTGQQFKLSLKLTSPANSSIIFDFLAESGSRTLPGVEKAKWRKKKNKSPSARRRDKERKERFLRRKDSPTSPVSPASPTFHSIAPTGIPQWEGNSTLTEEIVNPDIPTNDFVPPSFIVKTDEREDTGEVFLYVRNVLLLSCTSVR